MPALTHPDASAISFNAGDDELESIAKDLIMAQSLLGCGASDDDIRGALEDEGIDTSDTSVIAVRHLLGQHAALVEAQRQAGLTEAWHSH